MRQQAEQGNRLSVQNRAAQRGGADVEPVRERTLLDWLGLVRDGWKAVAVLVMFGLLASFLVTLHQPTEYGAVGTVLVSPGDGFLDPGTADALPALTDTVARLAKTPVVLRSTATSFANAAEPNAALAHERRDTATIDWLRQHLSARQVGTSSIIEISGTARTQRAAIHLTRSSINTLTAIVNSATPGKATAGIVLRVFSDAEATGRASPTPVRNALIGVNAGLVLGVALALLLGASRKGVRDPRAIAAALGVPFLGVVGRRSRRRSSAGDARFAEVRRRMLHRGGSGTFLLTGTVSREELAAVAEGLARAVATGSMRTVLVAGEVLVVDQAIELRDDLGLDDARLRGALRVIRPKGAGRGSRRSLRLAGQSRRWCGQRAGVSGVRARLGPQSGGAPARLQVPSGTEMGATVALDGAPTPTSIEDRLQKLREDFEFVAIAGPGLDLGGQLSPLVVAVDSVVLVAARGTPARQLEETRWFLADLDREAEGVIVLDRRSSI
jgi:capsular polysaccharide biosynthesis protein